MSLFNEYRFDPINYLSDFFSLYDLQNLRLTSKFFLSPQLTYNRIFTGGKGAPARLIESKERIFNAIKTKGKEHNLSEDELQVLLRVEPSLCDSPLFHLANLPVIFYNIAREYPIKSLRKKNVTLFRYFPNVHSQTPVFYDKPFDCYFEVYNEEGDLIGYRLLSEFRNGYKIAYYLTGPAIKEECKHNPRRFYTEGQTLYSKQDLKKMKLYKHNYRFYTEPVLGAAMPKKYEDRFKLLLTYSNSPLARIAYAITVLFNNDVKLFGLKLVEVYTNFSEIPSSLTLMKWYYCALKDRDFGDFTTEMVTRLHTKVMYLIHQADESEVSRTICGSYFSFMLSKISYSEYLEKVRDKIREIEKNKIN